MKVLLLNATDIEGGAARGTTRLLQGLRDGGTDARMLVQQKFDGDPCIAGPEGAFARGASRLRRSLDRLLVAAFSGKLDVTFSAALMPDNLPSRVAAFAPDLLHLNWMGYGMMRVETLPHLNLPLVWTCHDSWPFTGGCHIPHDCTRYRESCGNCPVLGSSAAHDLSNRVWRRKEKAWRDLDLTVVAPSSWLAGCAGSSSLFCHLKPVVIPNGLDTDLFRPLERQAARDLLSLPQDRKLLLFGAKDGIQDANKGFSLLVEALHKLASDQALGDLELVVFGSAEPRECRAPGIATRYLGWIDDETTLNRLYAAADAFVFPSLQESFGYTALEAMASGTPCVAFRQGGVIDIVDHGVNGYLARPYEPDDLAAGIAWVLEDPARTRMLSDQARRKAVANFSLAEVAGRYAELYRELIGRSAGRAS